nr:hypothetical protein BCT18_18290 [Vibrio cyclitrophicus]
MQEDGELLDKLNLSVDEIAFYRALVDNESSVRELGDDNLRKLAIELTHQLRKSATVDWQKGIVSVLACVTSFVAYCAVGSTLLMQQKKPLSLL